MIKIFLQYYIVTVLFTVISISTLGQCYRKFQVPRYNDLIPNCICLPDSESVINYIYTYSDNIDFDLNGLGDIVFNYSKSPLKDGDTIYTCFYSQVNKGEYKLFRIYNNLKPIYFDRYDLDYKTGDSLLDRLKNRDDNFYPLRQLRFHNDSIFISTKLDAEAGGEFCFVFNKNIKTYILQNVDEYFYVSGTKLKRKCPNIRLEEFNYFNIYDYFK